jgi:hypothetical protein
MKPSAWIIIVLLSAAFVSCQKAYSPEGLVLPGTGGTNTALLIKSESNTSGTTEGEVKTYEYDGSKRISKITTVDTDSFNVSMTFVYRFVRDADGKITQIRTNALAAASPNAGFPDTITIDVHYPTGSSNYDYTKYSFDFLGTLVLDSVAYTYNGNTIVENRGFQRFVGPDYQQISRTQYSYSGSNISAIKIYDPGTSTLAATINYEYDNKFVAFSAGKESFLYGLDPLMVNANNVARATIVFNIGGMPNINLEYTYQYNTANLPISGNSIETPKTKTTVLKFTYQ